MATVEQEEHAKRHGYPSWQDYSYALYGDGNQQLEIVVRLLQQPPDGSKACIIVNPDNGSWSYYPNGYHHSWERTVLTIENLGPVGMVPQSHHARNVRHVMLSEVARLHILNQGIERYKERVAK